MFMRLWQFSPWHNAGRLEAVVNRVVPREVMRDLQCVVVSNKRWITKILMLVNFLYTITCPLCARTPMQSVQSVALGRFRSFVCVSAHTPRENEACCLTEYESYISRSPPSENYQSFVYFAEHFSDVLKALAVSLQKLL